MLEPWYCLCGGDNEKCSKKDTCLRAISNYGPGIYTISCFYKEGEDCEDYIPLEEDSCSSQINKK